MISPRLSHSSPRRVTSTDVWTPIPVSDNSNQESLVLDWKGHSLSNITTLIQDAREMEEEGNIQSAKLNYRDALAGFAKLLSPTDEDTNLMAYQLATFYGNHNRMNEANKVLNWSTGKHFERREFHHPKMQAHLFRVIDMLQNWGREDTALGLNFRLLNKWNESISKEGQKVFQIIPRQSDLMN